MSEPTMTRYEPQAFTDRTFPRDPYVAWLQERAADRERDEDHPIRWVYRARITSESQAAVSRLRS